MRKPDTTMSVTALVCATVLARPTAFHKRGQVAVQKSTQAAIMTTPAAMHMFDKLPLNITSSTGPRRSLRAGLSLLRLRCVRHRPLQLPRQPAVKHEAAPGARFEAPAPVPRVYEPAPAAELRVHMLRIDTVAAKTAATLWRCEAAPQMASSWEPVCSAKVCRPSSRPSPELQL